MWISAALGEMRRMQETLQQASTKGKHDGLPRAPILNKTASCSGSAMAWAIPGKPCMEGRITIWEGSIMITLETSPTKFTERRSSFSFWIKEALLLHLPRHCSRRGWEGMAGSALERDETCIMQHIDSSTDAWGLYTCTCSVWVKTTVLMC